MKNVNSYVPKIEISRYQSEMKKVVINNSQLGADFCRSFYFDDIHVFESSFILLLNNSNETIGFAKISQGGLVGAVVDVRLVAHYAVQALAVGVIICHNHPSGKLQPSEQDKRLTVKVKQGLDILDIKLLDHIILTGSGYFSFADEGLL